jgi:ankyrin repeat protein
LVFDFDILRKTGLHWAVMRNHKEIVKLLIRGGAHLTARDEIGRTPLYMAAKKRHLESAIELINAGTQVISSSMPEESILKSTEDPLMLALLKRTCCAQVTVKLSVKPRFYYNEWKKNL